MIPEPDAAAGRRPRTRLLVAVPAALFAVAIVTTLVRHPDGVVVSSDPGYAPRPVLLLLIPSVLAVGLTLALPRGAGASRVVPRRPRRLRAETAGLLLVALGFPALVPFLPLPEDYVLVKAVLFILVPLTALGLLARRGGPSLTIEQPSPRWRVPLLPAVLLGVTSTVGPLSQGAPPAWPPLAPLLVAAVATALTAGFGEELLYRRLLQTRLEAWCGPTAGLLWASLLFGLMHATSHGDGPLWADALQAITLQGTTGLALGLIWRRWRRLEACVLGHVLLNGFAVLVHLVGLVV